MVTLEKFQGHIVLLCKMHYKYEDIFQALKKIWAIRCGYDYKDAGDDVYAYIAIDMYKIIKLCEPNRFDHYMDSILREISFKGFSKPKDMTPIQAIIWEFRSILCNLQIKEKDSKGKYITLIKLPKPMKMVFNRILRGNGRYKDYDLISKS